MDKDRNMDETLNFAPFLSSEQEKCGWDDADETQIILNVKGRIFLSSLRLSGLTLSPFLLSDLPIFVLAQKR